MANIVVAAGSTLTTPPVGEATLFIDTENNNILSLKLSDGSIREYSDAAAAECCSCIISKQFIEDIGCALKKGMMTATEYGALVQSGMSVTSTETDDGSGNKTCNVSVGPQNLTPTAITIADPGTLSILAGPVTLTKTMTPLGSNPSVVWVSGTPANATINAATGEITPLVAGATIVTAYSTINPAVSGSRTITVIAP